MIICIGNVLSGDEHRDVTDRLTRLSWADGRASAGWAAKLVKHNQQAAGGDPAADALKRLLGERVLANELFQLAVRPKVLSPLLVSRYGKGMSYGNHVDDALMHGVRSDVSFTLFLSDPESYEGGALIIESPAGQQDYKLPMGTMVAYPSRCLHRVEPVKRGVRLAAVGWVRSYVRSNEHRELLFDLETARRQIFDKDGKTPAFDLLSKCAANLLRQWAED